MRFGIGGQKRLLGDVVVFPKSTARCPKNAYICTENLKQDFRGFAAYQDNSLSKGISFREGDTLFANIRPYLKKTLLASFDGCCSPDVICFRPVGILSGYLYYTIANEHFIDHVMEACKGSKMPRGDRSWMLQKVIFVPSEEEQMKVASFLCLIDKRIETQNKIIEDCVRLKEETLRRLFSNRGKCNKGEEKPLSKFLHPGSKEPVDPLKYKRITIHLNLEGLSFSSQTRELKDTRPFFVRHAGELIIGKQNYFNGSICLVDKQYDMAVCSNAIMSFEITGINPRFLLYATSNKWFLEAMKFYANGTGQKELSEKDFLNFSITVPDRSLQVAIANAVDSIENKILFERQTLRHYVEMKKYLLSAMFI